MRDENHPERRPERRRSCFCAGLFSLLCLTGTLIALLVVFLNNFKDPSFNDSGDGALWLELEALGLLVGSISCVIGWVHLFPSHDEGGQREGRGIDVRPLLQHPEGIVATVPVDGDAGPEGVELLPSAPALERGREAGGLGLEVQCFVSPLSSPLPGPLFSPPSVGMPGASVRSQNELMSPPGGAAPPEVSGPRCSSL